ncbi:MAG: phage tail protein [Polymorphobacter sp.]
MPQLRPPLTGCNFNVDLGDGAAASGFATVIFPRFAVAPDPADPPLLHLRRAATGKLELYDWWDSARRDPKATLRTVVVDLLSADFSQTLLRWRFTKARPVSLDYGPLDANTPAIVSETLVLAFERVDMPGTKPGSPR